MSSRNLKQVIIFLQKGIFDLVMLWMVVAVVEVTVVIVVMLVVIVVVVLKAANTFTLYFFLKNSKCVRKAALTLEQWSY